MHRSLLLAGALGCACTTLPGGENVHLIRAHWASESCIPVGTSRSFDLEALGDFPPSNDTSEQLDGKHRLVVPGATRGVEMTARDGFTTYQGLGESLGEDRDIDVSLWPAAAPCQLNTTPTSCDYPGQSAAASAALGVSPDGRTLILAGGDDANAARGALTVDLATGTAVCVTGKHGMQLARSGARVTPFGDKVLVSGGYDPKPQRDVTRGTAEVFDPASERFDPELVALNGDRAHHAAVTLASGEVLLVGGVGESRTPLDSLEVLVPESNLHRADVTTLPGVRVDPIALRLSDDRIFVGGGTDALALDGGAAVADLLWLSADATTVQRRLLSLACPDDAPGTKTVKGAFAAMPGGAVLAVGGCTLPPEGSAALPCAEHCEGSVGCPSNEIFWIDRDVAVVCCGSDRTQCGQRRSGTFGGGIPAWTDPVLVPGAEGAPWLLEGDAVARRFHRFDPWAGQFATVAVVAPADPLSLVAADRGLFLWTQAGTPLEVQGFRHGVRSQYTQAVAPLLLAGGEGIVPNRAPSPSTEGSAVRVSRDASTGAVRLPAGAELVVTDTTYADVSVVIQVASGPPPLVRVGADLFGSKRCPWPSLKTRAPASFDATLTRRAGGVTLSIGSQQQPPCDGPTGRAGLAIVADAVPVILSSVTVTRLAP